VQHTSLVSRDSSLSIQLPLLTISTTNWVTQKGLEGSKSSPTRSRKEIDKAPPRKVLKRRRCKEGFPKVRHCKYLQNNSRGPNGSDRVLGSALTTQ
jgi:hypothetical protein